MYDSILYLYETILQSPRGPVYVSIFYLHIAVYDIILYLYITILQSALDPVYDSILYLYITIL